MSKGLEDAQNVAAIVWGRGFEMSGVDVAALGAKLAEAFPDLDVVLAHNGEEGSGSGEGVVGVLRAQVGDSSNEGAELEVPKEAFARNDALPSELWELLGEAGIELVSEEALYLVPVYWSVGSLVLGDRELHCAAEDTFPFAPIERDFLDAVAASDTLPRLTVSYC